MRLPVPRRILPQQLTEMPVNGEMCVDQQLPKEDRMYRASLERDTRFEGVFVMAVKTTGIFCRPSCHARKPLRENVEFFATPRDALAHGYRPCRVCRPLEPFGTTPEWIAEILREVESDPASVPSDRDLRARGVDPARLRRWFRKHHNMTFRAYLRQLRLNRAYSAIRAGGRVTDTAFDHGFESLSGFGEGFRRTLGITPSASAGASDAVISIARILTPLGPMLAGATDAGLCLLEFADRRMLERQMTILQRRLRARAVPGAHPLLAAAQEQIGEYFAGSRRRFELPLDLRGTPFQMAVWRELGTIPYGVTRSYAEQAARIGRPTAVRAVGRANGENRLAIVVPCHRVVGANGALTGYGGGLWRKRKLLELEGVDSVGG
jgi:AraC family transcriptional regulator, regulatory protein of adaptative response / methylated-DNA-[protein]-cysteine methyltransferase